MNKIKKLNLLVGWIVFAIAAFVYLSTIEPTASFWDCGEFIAASYKLEVGHPPGAPFFLLVGRVFSLFAGDNVEKVPVMINALSGLASAFTILFLFWTITHLIKKTFGNKDEYSLAETIIILAGGVIGALSYTFSDTFWFSAVEGEVYASSSLFTAMVFWAILKWENIADQPHANRWLILIGYLMGLSIGIHLLNLLAIPAIVLIYYFRNYTVSRNGVILAVASSFGILITIMYIIIPGLVVLAAIFERMFVNGFSLPYSSGLLVYLVLISASLIFGIYITHKKRKLIANTALLLLTVILMGYSSYALIMIRSNANPPMDQNNPENLYNLLYYLNREQYGDRPLFHGQHFSAPVKKHEEGKAIYAAIDGKYKIVSRKPKITFDPEYTTLFPRMWSRQENHVEAYLRWINVDKRKMYETVKDQEGNPRRDRYGETQFDYSQPKAPPNFKDNIKFLFRYQFGHMYFRYFMWNFAGRQNDIQSHYKEEITKGNWLTGFNSIDKARLGSQVDLPKKQRNNKAHNKLFLLPLALGLIGMFFHYQKHEKDFWVVLTLFVMTGIAIVLYLNQNPMQPRERDYAYAGSFYAFAIWIGLGVPALFNAAKNSSFKNLSAYALRAVAVLGFIAVVDLISNGSLTYSLSIFVLILLMLFLLVLFRLLANVFKSESVIAAFVCLFTLSVPVLMAVENWDDHDRSNRFFARDFASNYLNSCAPNAIIFTNGDNDTFPLWYAQEVEGIRTDIRVINLSYLSADWYIEQMTLRAYESDPVAMTLRPDQYRQGNRDIVYLIDRVPNPIHLKEAIEFVAQDDPKYKKLPNVPEAIDYIPQRNLIIKADSAKVFGNGTIQGTTADRFQSELPWKLNKNYLYKNLLMVADFLATNDWNRPIYYAITVGNESYMNLQNYFEMQGLAYRIVPANMKTPDQYFGGINTEIMYDNMMNKFRWGTLGQTDIYYEENVRRMLSNTRNNFASLSKALINESKKDSALIVLDKCVELIPDDVIPYDLYMVQIAENYYQATESEKAEEIINLIRDNVIEEMDYYLKLEPDLLNFLSYEIQFNLHTLNELSRIANENGNTRLGVELNQDYQQYGHRLTQSL